MDFQIQIPASDFAHIAPLLIVVGLAFVVLLWDTLLKPSSKGSLVWLSLIGLVGAGVFSANQWMSLGSGSHSLFYNRLVVDRFSLFFELLFFIVAGLVILISRDYLDREQVHIGEYYALIFFAVAGMMVLAMAADLMMVFIGVEVMSISVYALAAFNRSDYRCIEGSLKYLILGAFASAFLLYGIALLYGETGSTNLEAIRSHLSTSAGAGGLLVKTAIGMLLIGFAFKIAAVPFHMWAPDVYQGAATPITAFMATGVKAGAFAAMIRTFLALAPVKETSSGLIWGLAAITMIVGNFAAIRQTNIKRMLAYSSIGHSGYLLAGFLAIQPDAGYGHAGVSSMLFYLAAYVFMNIGAFSIVVIMGRQSDEPLELSSWSGIGFKHPWLGAAMALFLLSLGGLPPTAGFFGKFYLFSAVLDAGYTNLVILAVMTSAAAFYYYLRVIVYMYMRSSEEEREPRVTAMSAFAVSVASLATLWIGLVPPGPISFLQWARESVKSLI